MKVSDSTLASVTYFVNQIITSDYRLHK